MVVEEHVFADLWGRFCAMVDREVCGMVVLVLLKRRFSSYLYSNKFG